MGRSSHRGFSYVELLLVVTLAGLLTAALIPSISSPSGGLEAAVKKVVVDLRYAQELASINNTNYGIQFVANGAYVLYQGTPATPATNPLTLTPFSENLSAFRNVRIVNSLQIEFNPLGRPVLGSGTVIPLTDSQLTRNIRITPNTGLAEVL